VVDLTGTLGGRGIGRASAGRLQRRRECTRRTITTGACGNNRQSLRPFTLTQCLSRLRPIPPALLFSLQRPRPHTCVRRCPSTRKRRTGCRPSASLRAGSCPPTAVPVVGSSTPLVSRAMRARGHTLVACHNSVHAAHAVVMRPQLKGSVCTHR